MLISTLTKSIFSILLVALVISAGATNGQEWVSASFSVAPDTPPSKTIPPGTQNELVLKFRAKATGDTVSFYGATLELSGLFTDEYFQEVSIYEYGLCLGSGIFEFGIANLDFTIISLLPVGIEKDYEVRLSLSLDAQPGTQFKVGLYDVDTNADVVAWPMDDIWSNPMTIGSVDIGSLKVVAEKLIPAYAFVGEICSPAGAILQNSEIEPVFVDDVIVQVDGDFAYGDLENLAVGIGDSVLGRIGPVEPGGIYHFDNSWRFEKNQEKELEASVFVKSGAGKKFSVSVIDIVATGESYGFRVPVYGLPIGGVFLIEIIGEEPTTGFYGYVTDINAPIADLKATIVVINAETKEFHKTISENGYYEIIGLEPGAYWLICFKQYYYASIRREMLLPGEFARVDFQLKPKK